jgi:hypothetical protein
MGLLIRMPVSAALEELVDELDQTNTDYIEDSVDRTVFLPNVDEIDSLDLLLVDIIDSHGAHITEYADEP